MTLILAVIALALGAVAIIEARGRSLTGWAVMALSFIWILKGGFL